MQSQREDFALLALNLVEMLLTNLSLVFTASNGVGGAMLGGGVGDGSSVLGSMGLGALVADKEVIMVGRLLQKRRTENR